MSMAVAEGHGKMVQSVSVVRTVYVSLYMMHGELVYQWEGRYAQRWRPHSDGGNANAICAPPFAPPIRMPRCAQGGERERGGALAADIGTPKDADPFLRCRHPVQRSRPAIPNNEPGSMQSVLTLDAALLENTPTQRVGKWPSTHRELKSNFDYCDPKTQSVKA